MKKAIGVFIALLVLTAAACTLLGLKKGPARPFSHKVHIQDQQMECVACHAKAGTDDKVAMPASLKKCMTCHEGGDEKKPPERKLAALYPGEKPQWSSVMTLPEEILFSHKKHVDEKVACAECHVGIESNQGADESLRLDMNACLKCHEERKASLACETCHKTIRKEVPPRSHALSWRETHGRVVQAGIKHPMENHCELCHTEQHCVNCHQDEAPKNHTHFWRLQGHAVAAGVDRTACTTCHLADFCDRCHQETAPRSHTASWMSPSSRHCLSCHMPLTSQNSCNACHGRQTHNTAPPRPANAQHAGATESQCRTCHNVIGLPHIDNGDNCGSCH